MKTRRILSLVVAVVMIVSTLAVVGLLNVFAATQITSAEQFVEIFSGQAVTGDYTLVTDVTLPADFVTATSFSGTLDGGNCTVSGISAPLFDNLAGEVKNLTLEGAIETSVTTPVATLGSNVSGDLALSGITNKVSINASKAGCVGGILGKVVVGNVTLTNCHNEANITAASKVGGVIGAAANATAEENTFVTVTNATNRGNVVSTTETKEQGVGGIIGYIFGTVTTVVERAANYGEIKLSKGTASTVQKGGFNGVGGIVGGTSNNTKGFLETITVRYSANFGDVLTVQNQGFTAGILGIMNTKASSLTIDHCYNAGNITGASSTACGIFAYGLKSGNTASITNCYNIGAISGASSTNVYAIARGASAIAASNNNYYVEAEGNTGIQGCNNMNMPTKVDKEELITALVTTDSEWIVDGTTNGGYPILKWQCEHIDGPNCAGECFWCGITLGAAGQHAWGAYVETQPVTAVSDGIETRECSKCHATEDRVSAVATGTITPDGDTYEVYTKEQLQWLAYTMNMGTVDADITVFIKDDIDLGDEGMVYINKAFTGTFDGENHTISGLNNIFFSEVLGTFKNVTLEGEIDVSEEENSNFYRVGSVARSSVGGGAHLSNVHSKVNITAYATNSMTAFGGLIGYQSGHNTTVDCSYSGTLKASGSNLKVSGIIAHSNRNGKADPVYEGCVFDGEIIITGTLDGGYVGGIFATQNNNQGGDQIKGCKVSGSITLPEGTVNSCIGGIVGAFQNKSGNACSVINGVFDGAITVLGEVIDPTNKIGAIVGSGTVKTQVENTISYATDYPVCGVEISSVTNSFAGADVVAVGAVFELGGVKYQRYNFGFIKVESKEFVTTGMTTADKFAAHLTLRDDGDKHDAKIVLLANMNAIDGLEAANVVITFTKNGEVVQNYDLTFGGAENDFDAFRAGLAAGEPYFAADGYMLFGVVVNDIPDGEWDTVSVTITEVATGEYLLPTVSGNYAE